MAKNERGWIVAASAAVVLAAPASAQPIAKRALTHPDAQARAYLFGAAFARSDLSTKKAGGMMFLPGRGLIRWQTRGKSLAEQAELRTEAIGLADARAVQAELEVQAAVLDNERHHAVDRTRLGYGANVAELSPLTAPPIAGARHQAGAALAFSPSARARPGAGADVTQALGVRNGAQFQDRSRLYLFGAASGQGVGMNVLNDEGAGWRNAGLSADRGGFEGQRQAGLALRKGGLQAALSYIREKSRDEAVGVTAVKDHRAMLNFTFVPVLGVR